MNNEGLRKEKWRANEVEERGMKSTGRSREKRRETDVGKRNGYWMSEDRGRNGMKIERWKKMEIEKCRRITYAIRKNPMCVCV